MLELAAVPAGRGLGRVGQLPEPETLDAFAAAGRARPAGDRGPIRVAGDPDRPVRTVAVCGGAGDSLFDRRPARRVPTSTSPPTCATTPRPRRWSRARRRWSTPRTGPPSGRGWPTRSGGCRTALRVEGTTVETRVSTLVTDPWTRTATRPTDDRSPALNAAATDQLRLLDLQALDPRSTSSRTGARRCPSTPRSSSWTTALSELRDHLVAAETEAERHRPRAEQGRGRRRAGPARAARDQQRLDSGPVGSPKELENLQHEIASLSRRQCDLEDVELEIMERLEAAQSRHAELSAQQADGRGDGGRR